jgi:O-antigen ligase
VTGLGLASPYLPVASPAADARVNPIVRALLYLFVLSVPFEFPHRSLPMEIPTLAGFALLAATPLNPSVCYRRLPPALLWFGGYLWVFLIITLVQGVEQRGLVLRLFITMAQLVLLFAVIYNMLADGRVLRGVLLALVAACTVRAGLQVLGIGATAHELWTGGARVTMLGQNANLSAIILSAGLVVVVGLHASRDDRLPRLGVLTWPVVALLGTAIVQTGSRGGLLCAGLGVATFLFRGRSPGQRLRNGLLALAAVGVLAWVALHSPMMRGRFEQAEGGQLAGREVIYPTALEMFSERPLLGWGPIDNQFEIARRIADRDLARRDVHNLVLELLTATGVVGAVPFLVGIGCCFWTAWGARGGMLGALPLALLVAVLAGTVTGTWIAAKIVWLGLALAAGAHWADARTANGGRIPCAA